MGLGTRAANHDPVRSLGLVPDYSAQLDSGMGLITFGLWLGTRCLSKMSKSRLLFGSELCG